MVFSDQSFLFFFLPFALVIGLACIKTRASPVVMLLLSLTFFYWSSGIYTLLLVASITINFAGGLLLRHWPSKGVLLAIIALNLALIGYFKYTYFAFSAVEFLGSEELRDYAASIVLPIGISFYTFQGLSYVVDVWRRDIEPEQDPILFGAYLSFFPQLIAGPIVRYKDVADDFQNPRVSVDMFAAGAARFVVGLSKKILIADSVSIVADAAFSLPPGDLSFAAAWLGAVAYSVQIYFDFSGYSDMAIGLGMMFGIRFLENFNHPYAASTITEFWRRWHISLSSWFRDYLYIPLGGNRHGQRKTYTNLMIVFIATGVWHGAAWTFLLWGLWHGAFLIAERVMFAGRASDLRSSAMRMLYFFPVVIFGWVLFRAPDVSAFTDYAAAMINPLTTGAFLLPPDMVVALAPIPITALTVGVVAVLLQGKTLPLGQALAKVQVRPWAEIMRTGFMAAALVACAIFVVPQEYSPFLYFRF